MSDFDVRDRAFTGADAIQPVLLMLFRDRREVEVVRAEG